MIHNSPSKATATAPSNIAFTKYWGRKNEKLRIPENGSISMCLSNLLTTTTVEFSPRYKADSFSLTSQTSPTILTDQGRVSTHLSRIRKLAGINLKAKVVSQNNFPSSTGLSSSASGFAALTLAATKAAGLKLSEKQLSILARQGSGSACRSIPSGFVEWVDGITNETSYAKQIFRASYWKIADVVAIISSHKKEVSTSTGQQTATSSPFMKTRLSNMKQKNVQVKKLIKERRFKKFGELIEAEALELHSMMMTQNPPLIYLEPNSILLMKLTQQWKNEGLPVYFTLNTGQDIHLIVEQKNITKLKNKLKKIKEVKQIIVNYPSEGTKLSKTHLF
jgi:diphosphomevalonate decarboxylase